jgi:4-hydroxy-L-threonine phosphate dehydrogenase PdxA
MSSPRRAAKDALDRAAKAARGSRPAAPPAKPNVKAATTANSAEAKRLAAAIERGIADGRLDVVSAEALQAVIAAACRLYTARREAGEQFMPVAKNSLAATDVMVTASGLLRAADLAAFELGMWQGWTGR